MLSTAETEPDQFRQIKLIVVGGSGVGKTSIVTRFAYEKFRDYTEATLGAAFIAKQHTLPSSTPIHFHIWDTAGQEKYRSIAPIYYRQAKIALCVYDITSMKSFRDMQRWVEELLAKGPKDMVLAVVGNKIDLCDNEEVDYATAKEYASKLGAVLKVVSAKDGKNIEELFNTMGQMALRKMATQSSFSSRSSMSLPKSRPIKHRCC